MQTVRPIEWIADSPGRLVPGRIRLIDQTRLPLETKYIDTVDLREMWTAIKELKVRGAPAIGIAAAMAVAVSQQETDAATTVELLERLERDATYLATSRPTAVNLFWALDRMRRRAGDCATFTVPEFKEAMAAEAVAIRDEDAHMCRRIGEHGFTLLEGVHTVLTHCNAGALATAEVGTALAPVYVAQERGHPLRVFADETRPLLQGSRLTAWELAQAGIDVTVICDNMAAQVMKEGRIDAVLVGSDRIAANGDAANKIGTYGVAVLAEKHGIPFYVLAPTSTFDMDTPNGECIPIEERGAEEITRGFGRQTAPEGIAVYSPAFDVTPSELITAIVCEQGIARPDYTESIAAFATAASP